MSTGDPHHHFRVRIDELTEREEQALTKAERWHREVLRLRSRIRVLEKSLEIWRVRRAREKP